MALLATGPWLYAQDGLEGALSRANVASTANLATTFRYALAAADFDGDDKADGAVLLDGGWLQPRSRFRTIEIHLSSRRNAELTFESNETGLAITALDVNNDGATDIVVEQLFSHKRLHIWLNDGRGGFRKVTPQDFPSAGEGIGQRLLSSPERQDRLAACLPPQRGSDGNALGSRASPFHDSSANEQAQVFASTAASRAVVTNSSRAPPFSESL